LYERRFGSFFYIHVTGEKLPKRRLYKKFPRKMLMKLTPHMATEGFSKSCSVEETCNELLFLCTVVSLNGKPTLLVNCLCHCHTINDLLN